jgi:phosphotransferase system HPr (HPr) family protein
MSASSDPAAEATVALPGNVALHARPAGIVAREARRFPARLTLCRGDREADAKSVLRVMALGAEAGSTVSVRGEGDGAAEAVSHIAGVLSTLQEA